jgi:DNA ligase-1
LNLLPTLYKKTSTGKVQTWRIDVETSTEDFTATIVTTYGQLNGKMQVAREVIKEGKNIGKANETSVFEQARAEAASQYDQKLKKGYVLSPDAALEGKIDTNAITGGIEPMLAHSYDKQGHKISFPAFVQPKLDGHRCIAIVQDGKCTLWSRTRKPINSMPHIEKELEGLYPTDTVILDGELYNHDYREAFEKLTSKIKQSTPQPGHEVVQYWVYDVATNNTDNFSARKEQLDGLSSATVTGGSIVVVDTEEVQDAEEMQDIFGIYLAFGFEGLMLRNAKGLYKNKRSYDLQKVKVMVDDEFEVVGITEGKGKMAGKAIFVCNNGDGKEFSVKMMGTLESLREYFKNPDEWIGKPLTVKYQNLSADGIPRFPIGLRFREDV